MESKHFFIHSLKTTNSIYSIWNISFEIRNNTSDFGEMVCNFSWYEYGEFIKNFDKKKNLTIIDAGANIWETAIWFHSILDCENIICIEPDKENLVLLSKNCNNIPEIKIIDKALYKNNDGVLFDNTVSKNASWITKNGTEVDSISIKKLFQDYNLQKVDIFKIDIEWWEWYLLNEENRSYFDYCNHIIIEYHENQQYKKIDLINYFSNRDYKEIKGNCNGIGVLYFY